MNRHKEFIDALFVVHQDTNWGKIEHIIRKGKYRRIFILTTHHLLGKERRHILGLASEVHTTTFASLLTDGEMALCDHKATEEMRPRLGEQQVQRTYMGYFIERSLWHKNAAAWSKLTASYHYQAIYYSPGLGVHSRFWAGVEGVSLETSFRRFKRHTLSVYGRKIRNLLKKRITHNIQHNGKSYIFMSTVGRLKFSETTQTRSTRISRITWLLMALAGRRGLALLRNLARRETSEGDTPILCATIHDYVHVLAEAGLPLLIFVDGYHPSNYPRSYVDMYGHGRFVVRNMLGEIWFQKHGKTTLKPPLFMASCRMNPVKADPVSPVTHILLALNHAGDWTALINRSDTDLLIEAFSKAARSFTSLRFVIRPHPTMATPEHEGKKSLNRINTFVQETTLPNLTVSQNTLADDLKKAQLVVSEYSQVLIDAYEMGKPGLVVNLTGRRSFMKDYEALGFPVVHSPEALIGWIKGFLEDPKTIILRQNQAVNAYNRQLMFQGYF